MICERCGYQSEDNITTCPACGTVSERARTSHQPSTAYGQGLGEPSSLTEANPWPPAQQSYQYGYRPVPTQQPAPSYQAQPIYTPPNNIQVSTKNDTALITEIILSLFGIFGVGWLMAGDTTVGIVLLICSIFVYWPIILLGTVLTVGIGLICLGPLAIGAIILNIVLLNNTLNRKATRFVITPQPMPPNRHP